MSHTAHRKNRLGARGRGVMTACGQFLPADLVVGADGARSKVRTAAHIQHDFYAYGDSGIVTHLDAQLPHQGIARQWFTRSEEHTSELQSRGHLVCRLLLEKKKVKIIR